MSQEPDAFSSQRVEETLEQLTVNDQAPMSASEQARLNPDARLVHDMQKLYAFEHRHYQRALQRVEDRLVEQFVTNGERPASQPVSPGQQARAPHTIQQGRNYSMEQKKSRMSTFGRRISILVAVLVMAVLVGSLVFVMGAAHQKTAQRTNNTTHTGSGPSVTPGMSPTPTQKPIQQGNIVYTSSASFDDFYAFAWSPDNQRIASSTNSQVQIWDATTGKNVKTFTPSGAGGSVLTLAWSPNGKSLAVGSGQLQIIDPTTGAVKRTFPSSQAFVGGSGGTALSAMNPFSGGNMIYATAWSPDGTLMAISLYGNAYGNVVDVWNVSTGQIVYTFRGQTDNGVESVSWSADGKYVASAGYDGTVQVWDAHTGQVIFKKNGISAAFAPTGMDLAFSNDLNNNVQVWDVAANKEITSYSTAAPGDLRWSSDGRIAIASSNPSGKTIVIFDASTGHEVATLSGKNTSIRSLAWSPNGKYIVAGGGNEGGGNYAQVWQVE